MPNPSTASLWRHADFLKLWAAQAVSSFGARITREGAVPIGSSPKQWSARFKNEVDKWAKVAKSAGLSPSN